MARAHLSSPDINAPLLLNGSAGTVGQVPVSQGPLNPPQWGDGGVSNTQARQLNVAFTIIFGA
jgi:hypothetical protein